MDGNWCQVLMCDIVARVTCCRVADHVTVVYSTARIVTISMVTYIAVYDSGVFSVGAAVTGEKPAVW